MSSSDAMTTTVPAKIPLDEPPASEAQPIIWLRCDTQQLRAAARATARIERGARLSERPRPSDPGGDEDVPSERESEAGREDSGREAEPRGEPSRDPKE